MPKFNAAGRGSASDSRAFGAVDVDLSRREDPNTQALRHRMSAPTVRQSATVGTSSRRKAKTIYPKQNTRRKAVGTAR